MIDFLGISVYFMAFGVGIAVVTWAISAHNKKRASKYH